MPNWKKAPEVEGDDDFPEPVPTKQYAAPIGPQQRKVKADQYEKPIGPEKEGIFKRAVRALNPDAPAAAEKAGKNFPKNVKQAAPGIMQDLGRNVGKAAAAMNVAPIWLRDNYGGGKSTTKRVSAKHTQGLPPWVLGHGMPWDRPSGSGGVAPGGDDDRVVRVVVTRTHASGRKTRSYRTPHQKETSHDGLSRLTRSPY